MPTRGGISSITYVRAVVGSQATSRNLIVLRGSCHYAGHWSVRHVRLNGLP
jgi:hypothetical protein